MLSDNSVHAGYEAHASRVRVPRVHATASTRKSALSRCHERDTGHIRAGQRPERPKENTVKSYPVNLLQAAKTVAHMQSRQCHIAIIQAICSITCTPAVSREASACAALRGQRGQRQALCQSCSATVAAIATATKKCIDSWRSSHLLPVPSTLAVKQRIQFIHLRCQLEQLPCQRLDMFLKGV